MEGKKRYQYPIAFNDISPSLPSPTGVGSLLDDDDKPTAEEQKVINASVELWKLANPVLVCRKKNDWKLDEVASRSGLSYQGVSLVEKGLRIPSLTTVIALSRGLRMTPGALTNKFDKWLSSKPTSLRGALEYIERHGE